MSLTSEVDRLLSGPRPLPIVTAGDPVLRRRADPYDGGLDPEVFDQLVQAMRQSMLAAPGVGLAAPQVGLGVQIAVIEDSADVAEDVARARERALVPFRVLINPSYEALGEDVATFYEGCLSVPGYQAVVTRARAVRLRAHDQHGRPIDETVTGWTARIIAHEVDHLHGTLYLDRALTRSLASTENYLRRWAAPTPASAGIELAF